MTKKTAYQLTVPTTNEPGKLAQVTSALAKEKINIRAITISSFGENGFLNIIADEPERGIKALQNEKIDATLNEVIAVLIDDKPGGLDKIVQLLAKEKINIENAYGFVLESWKNAVFVIEAHPLEKAKEILEKNKLKMLNTETLSAIEPFHYMKY